MFSSKFYNNRSCNDDYVPPFTRAVHVVNNFEDSNSTSNLGIYPNANIYFGVSKGEFSLNQDQRFIQDQHLEKIDAQIEAFYKTETIVMEANLSEPEDDSRPTFEDKYSRVEDSDLSYYHYYTIASFEKKPVNVFAKKTMSDEISVDCCKVKK
jgi:hypothetical protein